MSEVYSRPGKLDDGRCNGCNEDVGVTVLHLGQMIVRICGSCMNLLFHNGVPPKKRCRHRRAKAVKWGLGVHPMAWWCPDCGAYCDDVNARGGRTSRVWKKPTGGLG